MADQRINHEDDTIDYTAEGSTPAHEKKDSTDAGYDEAAHSGPSRYGVPEGEGGVFGTTGGGTSEKGFHVEERPAVYEGGGDESGKTSGNRGITKRTPGTGEE
ncbi:MAG TPA: hypothetical protein VF980_20370 [Thermoanaerobaculia bacterium]